MVVVPPWQKSARREETQEFAISRCDNARRGGPSGEIRGGESWERNNEARPRTPTRAIARSCSRTGREREGVRSASETKREAVEKGGNAVGEREEAREEEEEARKRGRGEGTRARGMRGRERAPEEKGEASDRKSVV